MALFQKKRKEKGMSQRNMSGVFEHTNANNERRLKKHVKVHEIW